MPVGTSLDANNARECAQRALAVLTQIFKRIFLRCIQSILGVQSIFITRWKLERLECLRHCVEF